MVKDLFGDNVDDIAFDESEEQGSSLTPIQRRILAPDGTEPETNDLGYMHSVLCQTVMPYRRTNAREHERRNGKAVLQIQAGSVLHPDTERYEPVALPWGPKARLVLLHLQAHALRNRAPVVEVQNSLTSFTKAVLGHQPKGRELKLMHEQLTSLATSVFRIGLIRNGRAVQRNTQLIHGLDLWIPNDHRQRVLWPSVVEFSEEYFRSLQNHAVPLRMEHIHRLSHSALALDIYAWLAQRLRRVHSQRGDFIPWTALYDQFGQEYRRIRDFRTRFTHELHAVCAVYADARVHEEVEDGQARGLRLLESRPPVTTRTQ